MLACYYPSAIERLAKKVVKQPILNQLPNTLRQRVGQLVRRTLAFSKKLDNHSGAIWYVIHHDNLNPTCYLLAIVTV